MVKKEKLCFNCLAHHKASECKLKHRCNTCKRKHHTSLCNGGDNTNGKNESSNQNVIPRTSHTLLSAMPKPMNTQPTGLGQAECKPDTCLLKTVVAIVTAGDKQARANILFDDGAQRSFVSQKLADLLNVHPPMKENITISSFGANTPLQQSLSVVNINVVSLVGEKIPDTALIVPNIATPLQNTFHTSIKNMPHLQDFTLAHPITHEENFEISLLIGQITIGILLVTVSSMVMVL